MTDRYTGNQFRGDVFGGLTAGVVALPLALAFGVASGLGVIIILIQLHPLLGAASVSSPMEAVAKLPGAFLALDSYSLILAFCTMAIVFFTPANISSIFPSPLIALLAGTLISIFFKFPVEIIGTIPASLPQLHLPLVPPMLLSKIIPMALAPSVLGVMDSLLTSVVADSMT